MCAITTAALCRTAIADCLTPEQLLALADQVLAVEPHHPRVDRWLLAAIALVESAGYPKAVGDNGRAVGLFQFHVATWRDVWKNELSPPNRTMAIAAMTAAVRYLTIGARRLDRPDHRPWKDWRLAAFHNAGNVKGCNRAYGEKVVRLMKTIQKNRKATSCKPGHSSWKAPASSDPSPRLNPRRRAFSEKAQNENRQS